MTRETIVLVQAVRRSGYEAGKHMQHSYISKVRGFLTKIQGFNILPKLLVYLPKIYGT